ncbi:hypothetical protein, partial [Streptomyces sp. NPDC023838]|uniref:hypothetical protein n=1 Tax=Streptomyces sp. NPDC023838 TaxID=3154325 RepID=UPI0033D2857D
LSDLLVFGRRAGLHAAEYASALAGACGELRDRPPRSADKGGLSGAGNCASNPPRSAAEDGFPAKRP